jgi:flagellar hook protein FlgE
MALNSSLFTGLSGLDSNQTWLNVVGNNIANANTTAFKASTVSFSPQFYVTDTASSGPSGDFGGSNASQEGMGSQVASISTDFTPGQLTTTGVDTDMAISGDGFFVLNSPSGQEFTRDGTFTLNGSNQLVTASGAYVQGYGADTNGNIIPGALQNITIPVGQATEAKQTQNASLQGNLNSGGAVAAGASILTSQAFTTVAGTAPTGTDLLSNLVSTAVPPVPLMNVGDTLSLAGTRGGSDLPTQTFTVTSTSTVSDLENFVNDALGIDPTVSEPGNPPPGTTLQTTGTTAQLTIIGNTGADNALTLGSQGLTDTTSGTPPFQMNSGTDGSFTDGAVGESTTTTITAYDSLGNAVNINLTTVLESKSATGGDTWRFYATSADNEGNSGSVVGGGTLTFDSAGNLVSSTGTTLSINRAGTGAQSPMSIQLDFSGMSALASTASNMVMSNQDGEPIGQLTSFSVGGDGTISGQYTNGLTKTLGQVVLANFDNPNGLLNQGGNIYISGPNSGSARIGPATTNGTGTIQSGSLEQSNVNISQEFINLIMASTGFDASSKVISTSDQLLEDLLNSQH